MAAPGELLPLQSLAPACDQSVSEEGLVIGSLSAGVDERLTTDWLSTLRPDLSGPGSLNVLILAARPLQGNACSERDDTSEVVPGSGRRGAGVGNSGATLPCGPGERTRGKKGAGAAS